MSVLELNKDNYEATIGSDKVTVLDCYAQWCNPCKMLLPIFHRLADEYADKINFVSCDVDEQQEIAAKCEIQGVPTLVVFKNGEELKRKSGFQNEAQLREWLQEYL